MTDHVTPRDPSRREPHQGRKVWASAAITTATVVASVALAWSPVSQAFTRSSVPGPQASVAVQPSIVPLSQLPSQGQEVHRRIHTGGPFLYSKDGTVFGNRERLLPRRTRGYYREYTVPTPGSRDRGARRIVCGGEIVQSPETCFYTKDHYQSFQKIDPLR